MNIPDDIVDNEILSKKEEKLFNIFYEFRNQFKLNKDEKNHINLKYTFDTFYTDVLKIIGEE